METVTRKITKAKCSSALNFRNQCTMHIYGSYKFMEYMFKNQDIVTPIVTKVRIKTPHFISVLIENRKPEVLIINVIP